MCTKSASGELLPLCRLSLNIVRNVQILGAASLARQIQQLRARQWAGNVPASEEDARRRIMDAFVQLSMTQGHEKVGMTDVARASGITRPTLYKYYANIEALYFDAVERVFKNSAREASEHLKQFNNLQQQLEASLVKLNEASSESGPYSNFLRSIVTSELVQQLDMKDREQAKVTILTICLEPIFQKHPHLEEKRRELMDVYARLAISLLFMPFADEQTIQRLVRMLLEGLEE